MISQNILLVKRLTVRGVGESGREPCRGTNAGRLGDAGGDARRWLKLNREDVEERGPFA